MASSSRRDQGGNDEAIRRFAYPLVEKALEDVLHRQEAGEREPIDPSEQTPSQQDLTRKGVEAERDRVGRQRLAEPLTERGRETKR